MLHNTKKNGFVWLSTPLSTLDFSKSETACFTTYYWWCRFPLTWIKIKLNQNFWLTCYFWWIHRGLNRCRTWSRNRRRWRRRRWCWSPGARDQIISSLMATTSVLFQCQKRWSIWRYSKTRTKIKMVSSTLLFS